MCTKDWFTRTGPVKRSQHFPQYSLNICWVMLKDVETMLCQTASTYQQMLNKWDAWGLGLRTMLRGVERACQTASTVREQKECWEDVETKFKRNQTLLNMSQQLSKQMLRECWDKFTRAYDANARVFTRMISQPRSQNPRYPYSWTSVSTAHAFDSMFQQRDASKGCQDSWTSGLTAHVRRITLSQRSL